MADEKSAIENFLDDIGQPKEDPFKSEDPFAPKAEEAVEESVEEQEEEKPLPFHKDPKIQRFIEKEISKRISQVEPVVREQPAQNTEDEITAVLTRIIGNDTAEKQSAVKDFRRVLGSLEEKGAQRALAEFEAQAQAQRQEDINAQEELDTAFEEIEDTFGVDISSNSALARRTRSEFVDFVRKVAPKNEDGEVSSFPDMVAAFEEFQERSKRSTSASRAKELASRGMTRSTDASAAPVQTDKSWKGIEKLFNRLS